MHVHISIERKRLQDVDWDHIIVSEKKTEVVYAN